MHGFGYLALLFLLAIVVGLLDRFTRPSRKRRSRSRKKRTTNGRSNAKKSSGVRSDEVILHSRLEDLGWAEFERLLYLYFTDKGYQVIEQGVGGNGGGVDLILVDKRTNERTAVQAKHWGHGPVGPNVIRELHSARWNMKPTCLYALLVTSNDVTQQARDEARERHMEFWHGAVLKDRLEQWGKWKPNKRAVRKLDKQDRGSTAKKQERGPKCVCGASMVKRKNPRGEAFWGCSTYPKCRHTVNIDRRA